MAWYRMIWPCCISLRFEYCQKVILFEDVWGIGRYDLKWSQWGIFLGCDLSPLRVTIPMWMLTSIQRLSKAVIHGGTLVTVLLKSPNSQLATNWRNSKAEMQLAEGLGIPEVAYKICFFFSILWWKRTGLVSDTSTTSSQWLAWVLGRGQQVQVHATDVCDIVWDVCICFTCSIVDNVWLLC